MNQAPNTTKEPAPTEGIVRAEDVAARYKVSPRTVFYWKDSGKIPHIKIAKTIRFDMRKVIEAIEGQPLPANA